MSDPVNRPSHYTRGSIEVIDIIRDQLGKDGFFAYCRGSVIKYTSRAGHKLDGAEDLRKAKWYADRMIELFQEQKSSEQSNSNRTPGQRPRTEAHNVRDCSVQPEPGDGSPCQKRGGSMGEGHRMASSDGLGKGSGERCQVLLEGKGALCRGSDPNGEIREGRANPVHHKSDSRARKIPRFARKCGRCGQYRIERCPCAI